MGNSRFGFICFNTFILVFFLVRCIMMAGKDDLDDCDIIKQGLMVKRSQNKKRFIPINYKQRWFVLTTKNFIYYESESEVSRWLEILMVLMEVLLTIYNYIIYIYLFHLCCMNTDVSLTGLLNCNLYTSGAHRMEGLRGQNPP